MTIQIHKREEIDCWKYSKFDHTLTRYRFGHLLLFLLSSVFRAGKVDSIRNVCFVQLWNFSNQETNCSSVFTDTRKTAEKQPSGWSSYEHTLYTKSSGSCSSWNKGLGQKLQKPCFIKNHLQHLVLLFCMWCKIRVAISMVEGN